MRKRCGLSSLPHRDHLVVVIHRAPDPNEQGAETMGIDRGDATGHTAEFSARRRPQIRRLCAVVSASAVAAVLAFGPSAAFASTRVAPRASAMSYCSKISMSKISTIVGTKVTLLESPVVGTDVECIYFGSATSATHPEVIISMETGIPASQLATRAAAEARLSKLSGSHKLVFGSLSLVGPTAFSWYYAQPVNGGQIVGVADNKGTTGYGAVLGGPAKLLGTPSSHVSAVEKLLALGMAA